MADQPTHTIGQPGDRNAAIGRDNLGTINTGDTHIHAAPPTVSALHQLPAPVPDFVGREEELRELRANFGRGVTITGVQGQGGVGKTQLALKLAWELKGQYPDAQFYLNLNGASLDGGASQAVAARRPLTPVEAMAHIIRGYHPLAKLPDGEREMVALYTSVLTEAVARGQRVLLLLDNAADQAQVEPLMPPPGCAVLVTSRRHFTLPGMFAKDVTRMPRPDAIKLLLEIAPRIAETADEIAELCGDLPLALRVAATNLKVRDELTPADYVRRLQTARLRHLPEVEAALSVSYAMLTPEQQRQWRALSVFPASFDAEAAAYVWEVADKDAAVDGLGDLRRLSLLERDGATGRYNLHDLARLFAGGRMDEAERDACTRRHAQHYAARLAQANKLYLSGGAGVTSGLQLFDRERANIAAGFAWAKQRIETDNEAVKLAIFYPDSGAHIIHLRHPPSVRIDWFEVQLKCARQLGWRKSEGGALCNLGNVYASVGKLKQAIEFYEQDLKIQRGLGDRSGESADLCNLSIVYTHLGETDIAIELSEQALEIDREIANYRGQSADLGNLGTAYLKRGEVRRAIERYQEALGIDREIGNTNGESGALGNLGLAYATLNEPEKAIIFYKEQLVLVREIGDRRGEAIALFNMALSLEKLGGRAEAIDYAVAALRIFEEIESPYADGVRQPLAAWRREEGQTTDEA